MVSQLIPKSEVPNLNVVILFALTLVSVVEYIAQYLLGSVSVWLLLQYIFIQISKFLTVCNSVDCVHSFLQLLTPNQALLMVNVS